VKWAREAGSKDSTSQFFTAASDLGPPSCFAIARGAAHRCSYHRRRQWHPPVRSLRPATTAGISRSVLENRRPQDVQALAQRKPDSRINASDPAVPPPATSTQWSRKVSKMLVMSPSGPWSTMMRVAISRPVFVGPHMIERSLGTTESSKLKTRLMPRFRIDFLLLLRCHVDKRHRPAGDIGHIAVPLLNCLPLYQGWSQRSVE
jgi:hypothetical protein